MITNNIQLAASLRYIASWADHLEGMRRFALENEDGMSHYASQSAGPLHEVRRVLAEARAYLDTFPDVAQNEQRIAAARGNGQAATTPGDQADPAAEIETEKAAR